MTAGMLDRALYLCPVLIRQAVSCARCFPNALLIVFLLGAGVACGQSSPHNTPYRSDHSIVKPSLTEGERQWLRAHPVIRLGVDDSYAPYSFIDGRGRFSGASADFFHIMQKQLGVKFQVTPVQPWHKLLGASISREIDMIAPLVRTEDRLNHFAFTDIYLKTPLVVMTRSNDFSLRSAADLKTRKVALVRAYSSTQQVLSDYPKVQPVLVDTPLQGLVAVATGQADAYVGAIGVNTTVASRNGLTNLRVAAAYDIENGQRFGVRGDWPELAVILDKALAAIPEEEKNRIHLHWVPQHIPEDRNVAAKLSVDEKRWVAGHPRIRFGISEIDEPVEFLGKDGKPAGLIPEYLEMIRIKTGLNVETKLVKNREVLLADFEAGKLDVISMLSAPTNTNGKYLLSDPFQQSALAIFALQDEQFIVGLSDLKGKKVALKSSDVNLSLLRRHPQIVPVLMQSPLSVMRAVVEGKSDAAIMEIGSAGYLIRQFDLDGLQMEHVLNGEETSLRFAIRPDWPELPEIMNKGLAAASAEEVGAILRKCLVTENERGVPRERIVLWASILIGIVLASFLFQFYHGNKRLRAESQRRREADLSALASERRFSMTFEQAAVGIALVAPDGSWIRVNHSLCGMLGYSEEELKRIRFQDVTHPEDLDADVNQVHRMLAGEIETYNMEKRYIRKDRIVVWGLLTVSLVRETAGKPAYFISVVEDVTQRKVDEDRIEFLAYRDILTGLPNRKLFADRMVLAMFEAQRMGKKLALLYLDLDHFKEVNDTLGHGIGDQLLIQVAARLQGCIRAVDTLGRHGGDEFLLIITNISGDELSQSVTAAADKIFEVLKPIFTIDGHELSVSTSIGIAVFPEDGNDFNTLLRKADTAMYSAKSAGRNAYYFFTEKMNLDAVEHEQIRSGLRTALERGELSLCYQPQVDIVSNRIIGVEALLRWTHPVMGTVAPVRFIPVAEASGLIIPIGKWVLEEACRQAVTWSEAGCRNLIMAVNLSALQFKHGDLIETVLTALGNSGLKPENLELELTESILIHDAETVLGIVQKLRAHGIRLSIDDFGTGYSSLTYLKRFPIDKLKIDQSFVRDMLNDPDDEIIVQSIIGLAKNLRLTTIAEGIESAEQLAALQRLGCREYQGYFFSRPLSAVDALALIRKQCR